jgi:hypothetical protein
VPDLKTEHPRDAIIKVMACAICGSDLPLCDGYIPWSAVTCLDTKHGRGGRGRLEQPGGPEKKQPHRGALPLLLRPVLFLPLYQTPYAMTVLV